jgi:NAD(P)H dehydrogenase (quinone)
LTYFWTLAMQQGMVWIGSGMKPAIAYDKAAPRESLNYIGGYGGAMATSPFDDPQKMSPADLATAAAFGQRFATFLSAGKTPNTPYVDFTQK